MTDTLWAALAASMSSIKNPAKDGRGNYGTYLTLDALTAAVRGPLADHGLTFRHDIDTDAEQVLVTCIVTHSTGEHFTVGPVASPRGSNIQHLMGATTYLRRMTLACALGLAGDDDDDGQQHAEQVAPVDVGRARGPLSRALTREPCTEAQRGLLGRLTRDAGYDNTIAFLASPEAEKILGGKPSSPLLKGHASTLIDALKTQADERELEAGSFAAELDEHEQAQLDSAGEGDA